MVFFSLQGDKGDTKVSESQDARTFSNRFLLFKETTQGCFSGSWRISMIANANNQITVRKQICFINHWLDRIGLTWEAWENVFSLEGLAVREIYQNIASFGGKKQETPTLTRLLTEETVDKSCLTTICICGDSSFMKYLLSKVQTSTKL